MEPQTIWSEASRLMANPRIVARIQELRGQIAAGLVAIRLWDIERAMREVQTNLDGAREAKQYGPAVQSTKQAIELSGLSKQEERPDIKVTSITINLNRRDGEHQSVIEGRSQVLPEDN